MSVSILIILSGVLLFVAAALIRNKKQQNKPYAYRPRGNLFTEAERSFLGVLKQAVGDHAEVFGKVRVADVLVP